MISSPVQLLMDPDFFSCMRSSMMSPKVSVKINLPFRESDFCRRIQVNIIVILRVFNPAVVKIRLKLSDIFPRLLHRRQLHGFCKLLQGLLSLSCCWIFQKKGLKFFPAPPPRLFQGCLIAAGKEQAQKIRKILRQRMYISLRFIHWINRKNHSAKTANEAKMNAVRSCPAKNRRAFWRTEVLCILPAAFNSHSG